MPVTRDRRYTRDRPCPICGGYDRAPRGKGIRCFGYLSDDGGWAHCTREEYAAGIQPSGKSGAYPHRLAGSCKCGRQHGARTVMGGSAYQTTATYDYRDPEGDLLFQVLRKVHPRTGEKAFLQRRPDPSSSTGWTWNLHGVERVLYHLPELQKADPEQPVFLVEGEKDVDRLLQVGLVATTNPGGAGKWAKRYTRWLKGRHMVVIPDNDDASTRPPYAGQLHANEVARSLVGVAATVRLVELPGLPPKGDVSDWLDQGGAPEKLLELTAMTPEYLPTLVSVSPGASANGHAPVEALEHTRPVWEGNKWRPVSQRIITEGLLGHGIFITAEEAPFYFDRSTRVLCDLEGSDMKLLLNERYQINAREALYSYLLEDMKVEARARGTRAHVRQFAHYDPRANALYLDLGRGRMLRMDGREIQEVDNGADGVLFAAPPGAEPWSYLPDAPRGVFGKTLVRSLKFAEGEVLPHTVEEQQALLLAWLLSVAFESSQPTKPLALARGPEGAGKSSLFRRAGRIFYGPTFEVDSLGKDSEQDFWVTVTNRRFVAWDNVDQRVPWLEDALATAATGVRITKRKLYETNQAVSFRATAFIGLTARTPRFRRPDVAERLLVFNLLKLNDEVRDEGELLQEIEDQRDALMSDYARLLNMVVAAPVASGALGVRLADFARLARRIGAGLKVKDLMESALGKLRQSQRAYAMQENELYALLSAWVDETEPTSGELDLGHPNEGRKVRTNDLFKELEGLGEEQGFRFRLASPVALGRQLQELESALEETFQVERGQDRKGSWWAFRRREDGS